MSEDKLQKQFEAYQELAKQDKKVDVAGLMIKALEKHEENLLPVKQKRWAFLISVMLPPFGLIFAVKFYFSGKDDGEQAAWVCGLLTAVGILVIVLSVKAILLGTGANLNQIQGIKPSDIQQFTQ